MRIYKSKRIITETGIVDGYLKVKDRSIIEILTSLEPNTDFIDVSDKLIIPGIFDTHTHGMRGWRMDQEHDEKTMEKHVREYLKAKASIGVTSVLPVARPYTFNAVYKCMNELQPSCRIIGVNNEGPFTVRAGEKGASRDLFEININQLKDILSKSHGMIKVMSFAPELKNAEEMIKILQLHNIQPAIGHSNINSKETKLWFEKGIVGITHLGNAMSGLHHRDVGCLGASILNPNVWCELITDGYHICNDMLKIILAIKPHQRICLISDSSPYAGLPEGDYPSYFDPSKKVHVHSSGLILEDSGRIAGSGISVLKSMKNLIENVECSIEDVCQMASLNPAIRYGISNYKGSISVGKDADFVVIDDDFNVIETILEGRRVYTQGDAVSCNI